jgi:hypothetical protein
MTLPNTSLIDTGILKLAMMEEFTPQELASTTDQGLMSCFVGNPNLVISQCSFIQSWMINILGCEH